MLLFIMIVSFLTVNKMILKGGTLDDTAEGKYNPGGGLTKGWPVLSSNTGTNWVAEVPGYPPIPNGGNIQGWGSLDYGDGRSHNPMQNGTLKVSPEEAAAFARSQGREDIAQAIENGADYDIYAMPTITITSSKDPKVSPGVYTLDEIEAIIKEEGGEANSTLYNSQKKVIDAMRNTWKDVDYDTKGHYWRRGDPVTTTTTTTTTTTPTTTTTTSEEEEPPEPDEVIPPQPPEAEVKYKLVRVSANDCNGVTNVETALKIDNTQFGVASGKPIPTSESLLIDVKTNWLTTLKGIEIWALELTEASDLYANAIWIKSITGKRRNVIEWKISGDITEAVFGETIPGDTPSSVEAYLAMSDEERDQYWVDEEYGVRDYKNWLDIDSETITSGEYPMPEEPLTYLVTAKAKANGNSEIGVKNLVFANEWAINSTTGNSVEIMKNGQFPIGCLGWGYDESVRVSETGIETPLLIGVYAKKKDAIDALNAFKFTTEMFYQVHADSDVLLKYNGIIKTTFWCRA